MTYKKSVSECNWRWIWYNVTIQGCFITNWFTTRICRGRQQIEKP